MPNWNQNNDVIQGNNMLLYLTSAATVVAYSTSVSLQIDSETIDTSSKFSCKWSDALGGKASYTINADALYSNNDDGISFDKLLEMMVDGEQIEWYIGEEVDWFDGTSGHTCENNPHTLNSGATYYNGKCVITSCSLEAGMDEAVSCSITGQGCGPIQKNKQEI